jgi:hypothetical protein
MRKLLERSSSFAKSSAIAVLISLVGLGIAAWQTFENINKISTQSRSTSRVDTTVVGPNLYELISTQRGLSSNCLFQGVTLDGPNHQAVQLSDADWVRQRKTLDATYRFECIDEKYDVSFSITAFMLSHPGSVQVVGYFTRGKASKYQISFMNTDRSQNMCLSGTLDYTTKTDNSGHATFGGESSFEKGFRPGCDVVVPTSTVAVTTKSPTSELAASSNEIDALVKSKLAKNCSFIAAVLENESNVPATEDKATFAYLNHKSVSQMDFAEYGPGPNDYKFDTELANKVAFQPTWLFDCVADGLSYSEMDLGGFIWGQQGSQTVLRRPNNGELNVNFIPWEKTQVTAHVKFELFDKNLKSCGVFTRELATYTEVDEYYRWTKPLDDLTNVNSIGCSIATIESFSIY